MRNAGISNDAEQSVCIQLGLYTSDKVSLSRFVYISQHINKNCSFINNDVPLYLLYSCSSCYIYASVNQNF